MYFFNVPHSIANMARLVRGTTGQAPDKTRLRQQYVQALVQAQGHALSDAPLPAVSFYERRICRDQEPFAQGFGDIRPLPPEEQQQSGTRRGMWRPSSTRRCTTTCT